MSIDEQIRRHGKEMGQEDLLNSLIEGQGPKEPKERPTKAEVKHRQRRKKKKKMTEASKRRNR